MKKLSATLFLVITISSFCFAQWTTSGNNIYNSNTGSVSIGTTNPNGYLFAVDGSAIATSMSVKAYANWPDYVFKHYYKLPELSELKNYIIQYHRLPGAPSAAEIAKNGFNLGDMDKLLMKKTEELTLYLIQKDAKINEQQQQIDTLKEKLQRQDERFKKLEAAVLKLSDSSK